MQSSSVSAIRSLRACAIPRFRAAQSSRVRPDVTNPPAGYVGLKGLRRQVVVALVDDDDLKLRVFIGKYGLQGADDPPAPISGRQHHGDEGEPWVGFGTGFPGRDHFWAGLDQTHGVITSVRSRNSPIRSFEFRRIMHWRSPNLLAKGPGPEFARAERVTDSPHSISLYTTP